MYPHKTLNSFKGVIRNKELSRCSKEEILAKLKKPRRNWHKKNYHQKRKSNNTNKHLNTNFQLAYNPQRNKKISYINEKIEQYISNPLRCFKCQKFGHHGNICNRCTICSKCGEREPKHTTTDCKPHNKRANCNENHPSYVRTCPVWQKEISTIKHSRNISSPES